MADSDRLRDKYVDKEQDALAERLNRQRKDITLLRNDQLKLMSKNLALEGVVEMMQQKVLLSVSVVWHSN